MLELFIRHSVIDFALEEFFKGVTRHFVGNPKAQFHFKPEEHYTIVAQDGSDWKQIVNAEVRINDGDRIFVSGYVVSDRGLEYSVKWYDVGTFKSVDQSNKPIKHPFSR